jgi:hypothetical protein
VDEAELVDRRELIASGVERDDVVDARPARGARRSVEVERLAAELAGVVGAGAELGHETGDVSAPTWAARTRTIRGDAHGLER